MWYKVQSYFRLESVIVMPLIVLIKMLKNDNHDKEVHWRLFLYGRSKTRLSRSWFAILFFNNDNGCIVHLSNKHQFSDDPTIGLWGLKPPLEKKFQGLLMDSPLLKIEKHWIIVVIIVKIKIIIIFIKIVIIFQPKKF